eukprot:gene15203-biopygen12660
MLISKSAEDDNNPWKNVPDFVLYLRFTSVPRFVEEYKRDLLRTMKIFFPAERSKLLLVLDNEKPKDHELGKQLKSEWPYPEVCYMDPGDPNIYHHWGKGRMYWDMMYPDNCTNATYVGYIDSDIFFTTLVTPYLLFENNKPIIVAKIGLPPFPCWEFMTEEFLGRKEVMQCMSAFPIMFKTSHIEMREGLVKRLGKKFDDIFRERSNKHGGISCLCQFSIMCNYVWHTHRDEHAWHMQMVPDGNWSGQHRVSAQVPVEYYHTEVIPEMQIPMPRMTIHIRYTITNGVWLLNKVPEEEIVEDFIKEGICYSGGFDRCPGKCKKWDKTKVHYNLFSFEFFQWFWDKRCLAEQEKHYKKVEQYLQYYVENKKEIFGLLSIDDMCTLL